MIQFWALLPLFICHALGCPIRLVDIVQEGDAGHDAGAEEVLTLTKGGLKYLERQESPIYVVPAVGVYRGGKSLLLNRIMGLRAPYIGGFSVGHGQGTHTRGVDVCAERVDGLGTVVWMDTEGLWSSEYARGANGPRIFSLALLFSSAVLLNSVKVLSDQFFAFFAEQQQVARILRQGLESEGLPKDALLPADLGVFWVLQQPIEFRGESGETVRLLDGFLRCPGDELRERVRQDFNHRIHEVPVAAHDVRQWDRLDQVSDRELLPEYVESSQSLRTAVFGELERARPMQSSSIASQMRLYFELVEKKNFSGELVKEVLEESEIESICNRFAGLVSDLAGALPVPYLLLRRAFTDARRNVDSLRNSAAETFHLDQGWNRRLDRCFGETEAGFQQQNSEQVVSQWQAAAGTISEDGSCFFLGDIDELIRDYKETYGEDFGDRHQGAAMNFARRLQRTRLVECVRLRDFLVPFFPWLVWPFCSMYMMSGTRSSLGTMALHLFILVGSYIFLQLTRQLPAYLDMEYPVLKESSFLLNLIMRVPSSIPWRGLATAVSVAGAIWSTWNFLKCLFWLLRPAGHGRTVAQMVNLELKINKMQKFYDAMIKDRIIASAIVASESIDRNDMRAANRALLGGLSFVCELGEDDLMRLGVSSQFQRNVRKIRQKFALPPKGGATPEKVKAHCLDAFVANGEMHKVLGEMMRLMQLLSQK